MTDLYIAGVAACVPPVLGAAEAVRNGWYDENGLREDGWAGAAVAGGRSPAEMAVSASRTALDRSGVPATDIDLLLYVSLLPQGPHMWCPQQYVERHVVGRDIPAFEIRQGCAGVLGAIGLAEGYLGQPGRRAALITAADNFGVDPATGPDPTLRWRYARTARTSRGSIFGDAASAVVVSTGSGFAGVLALSVRSLSDLEELYRSGEPMFPAAHGPDRPLRLGNRFAHYARTHGGAALARALGRLKAARTELAWQVLSDADLKPDQITRVLHVFAGNGRYLEELMEPLGIDPSRGVLDVGRRVGHLGASDHLVALESLVRAGQLGPGDHVLLMANGVGPSLACAALSIVDRPDWVA